MDDLIKSKFEDFNQKRKELETLVANYIEKNCVDFKKESELEYYNQQIGDFFDKLNTAIKDAPFIVNETKFSSASQAGYSDASNSSNLINFRVSNSDLAYSGVSSI